MESPPYVAPVEHQLIRALLLGKKETRRGRVRSCAFRVQMEEARTTFRFCPLGFHFHQGRK